MAKEYRGEERKKNPLAEREEHILNFWKEKDIFKKSLGKPAPAGDFVFYEGPPTANGRPGIHHLESRAFKDVIPRYKTMQGFRVSRKAGWDTHGLPVELEVEKKLGLKSKKEIESYGVAAFNEECKKSVWTYVDEWKDFTDRIGYWVDMEDPYVTYYPEYIESVWNIVSETAKRDLLYKDYKVVPWCPRCGTALSSHELAQGYETVKDLSVYVKFKVVGQDNTYLLAWTTTPWTLPGNVALAVGEDIDYVKFEYKGEYFIQAKDRMSVFSDPENTKTTGNESINLTVIDNNVKEMKGKDLIGLSYEPLYPYLEQMFKTKDVEAFEKAFKVYGADFVNTEDGTGIVHTAVMYGQDDFVLGTKVGLPKFHLVEENGRFLPDMDFLSGRFVKDEETVVEIIKDLAHRALLFKKEKYEHSYPHCWRCKTPLIYYARDSWYIRMSDLRAELLAANEDIHWEPEHIKEGRFGEWLREVKDWAISRERYWGTPLPIWQTEDGDEMLVVDSVATLKKRTKTNGNTFIFVRHGEAESNVQNRANFDINASFPLTGKGKGEVLIAAKEIAQKKEEAKPAIIYSSPYLRTKETASILAAELHMDESAIVIDDRLGELNFGDFDGKSIAQYLAYKSEHIHALDTRLPNGESFLDVKKRFGAFLYEIDAKHRGETIVVITHGIGHEAVSAITLGANMVRSKEIMDNASFPTGAVLTFDFVALPHNENYELDLHKPYIDEVILLGETGKEMRRVKEVMDVWFDSGSMPFAQHHYPFENKEFIESTGFPADYISEGIDQTRGWFYTLHAIGTILGKGKAFKNVICLGLILDKDGQKMSKSKGNAVNPWKMIDKYGVDALRYFMYTVNQPGESKNFDERTVDEIIKKIFNLLLNTHKFYELYAPNRKGEGRPASTNVLDAWILALLDSAARDMTHHLDQYKVLEAARIIRDFIADLSQWYLRRSRDRFKNDDEPEDRQAATDTLGFVLEELSILMAPFMPFVSEDLYQKLRSPDAAESVHLASWPKTEKDTAGLEVLKDMEEVRRLVSLGLEARARSGIKVRQPLSALCLKSTGLENKQAYLKLIGDEVNVKQITFNASQEEEVSLDTTISEELRREGEARELMRTIQEMRKEKGLSPEEKISLTLRLSGEGKAIVRAWQDDIEKTCGIATLSIEDLSEGETWFQVSF